MNLLITGLSYIIIGYLGARYFNFSIFDCALLGLAIGLMRAQL